MQRRQFLALITGAAVAAVYQPLWSKQAAPIMPRKARPNVIFFYVDDQGRGMLSYFRRLRQDSAFKAKFKTPHLDALLESGKVFDNAYGCMFCAPARASLLTGLHDCHSRGRWRISGAGAMKAKHYPATYHTPADFAKATANWRALEQKVDRQDVKLPTGELYLANVFKHAGYTTAQVGKLEYGFMTTTTQMRNHGWDAYFGDFDHGMCHGFFQPYLVEKRLQDASSHLHPIPGNTRRDNGQSPENENYANRLQRWDYAGKAVWTPFVVQKWALDYLKNDAHNRPADKPFFLFYSTPLPHGPVALPKSAVAYTGKGAKPTSCWPAFHPNVWKSTEFGDMRLVSQDNAAATDLKDAPDSPNQRLAFWDNKTGKKLDQKEWDPSQNHLTYLEMEYASMVCYFDQFVGEVMAQVKASGLDKDTLFVFSSDNGHELYTKQYYNRRCMKGSPGQGTSTDFRDVFDGNLGTYGLKWDNFEGGIHVPLAFAWPGHITPGHTPQLAANYDLLTTFAEWFGVNPGKKDGTSLLPVILDDKPLPKERFVIVNGSGQTIITNDGWKLRLKKKQPQLFFLPNDPQERTNLADQHPDRVAAMRKTLIANR